MPMEIAVIALKCVSACSNSLVFLYLHKFQHKQLLRTVCAGIWQAL